MSFPPQLLPSFPRFPSVIMPAPYPFTANPSNTGSSGSRPVQYSQQGQSVNTPSASSTNMAVNIPNPQQRGYYAQAPSNSPSTASLIPPSARGPPSSVQATFAKGPQPALRSMPSSSDLVRRTVILPVKVTDFVRDCSLFFYLARVAIQRWGSGQCWSVSITAALRFEQVYLRQGE